MAPWSPARSTPPNMRRLKIGVVPVINLEWIQKIHRDRVERGHSEEAIVEAILGRMPDYVYFICPQFTQTDINFQRVPTVDTSNPFIARWIPTPDESMVVIRFRNPRGIDFPYLVTMIRRQLHVARELDRHSRQQARPRHAAHPDTDDSPAGGETAPRRLTGARPMNVMTKQISARLDQPVTAALRMLAVDAVERAKSGHPGAPMGLAEVAAVLWRQYLRHNPTNPAWPDRDRFVLSNGHASMLLYALLHLTGYDLPIGELERFRQLHSRTPGHPEYGVTPGVETTTGPLGQGFANAVGMAIAEKTLAAQFNRPGHTIVDHRTFVIVGDGCLMEGISHEAASLAGRLGLGKLIAIYDDNGISIDGKVTEWFADDTAKRFEAYGWHVVRDVDGHDPIAIDAALAAAVADGARPSLFCCKTVIGRGAPTKQGHQDTHGAPLGAEEVARVRAALDWPYAPFEIPGRRRRSLGRPPPGPRARGRLEPALRTLRGGLSGAGRRIQPARPRRAAGRLCRHDRRLCRRSGGQRRDDRNAQSQPERAGGVCR